MRKKDLPKKALIVGLGKTGLSLIRLLTTFDIEVTVTDLKKEEELAFQLEKIRDLKVNLRLGEHRREDFLDTELIILSPGVDPNIPFVQEAKKKGVKVTGELEFACLFVQEPIIAITGTNGKTTVTTLIGKLFERAFGNVFVGGNIGTPLTDYLMEKNKAKFVILEVSSFQLETIEDFHPQCAVLLNVTEDHLDRYPSFSNYLEAKLRLFKNLTENDMAVINRDVNIKGKMAGKTFFFSSKEKLEEGAFLDGDRMVIRVNGVETTYSRSSSPLFGKHNTENLLASILVAHLYGIDRLSIEQSISEFRGLPHRTEFVREINGITFINDSKATNVDATKRALESVDRPTILIAGGKDKMGSYRPIISEKEKIKALILFGEAKKRIKRELEDSIHCLLADDLESAVRIAYELAKQGDIVLFSPMCSSFDMFRDYSERGDKFKEIVSKL